MSVAVEVKEQVPRPSIMVEEGSAPRSDTSSADVRQEEQSASLTWEELRNLLLLGTIFMFYMSIRNGLVIVIPRVCKHLLSDELDGKDNSPLYQMPWLIWTGLDIILAQLNAKIMERFGRRIGFFWAPCVALIGTLIAFCALMFLGQQAWLAYGLLNVAAVFMSTSGVAAFVKYAAAESAHNEAKKPLMVSCSISGAGIVGALVAGTSQPLAAMLDPQDALKGYGLFFLFIAGFCALSALAAISLRLPSQSITASSNAGEAVKRASLCSILRRTKVWTAIFTQAGVQFAVLVPLMSIPLSMQAAIPSLRESATANDSANWIIAGAVMLNCFGRFATGFLSTLCKVVDRLGIYSTLALGLLLEALSFILAIFGSGVWHFYVSQLLNGVGWNLAFVASTLLLLQSYSPQEKAQVTATNESLRFAANAVATLVASLTTWDIANVICFSVVSIVAVVSFVTSCDVVGFVRDRVMVKDQSEDAELVEP